MARPLAWRGFRSKIRFCWEAAGQASCWPGWGLKPVASTHAKGAFVCCVQLQGFAESQEGLHRPKPAITARGAALLLRWCHPPIVVWRELLRQSALCERRGLNMRPQQEHMPTRGAHFPISDIAAALEDPKKDNLEEAKILLARTWLAHPCCCPSSVTFRVGVLHVGKFAARIAACCARSAKHGMIGEQRQNSSLNCWRTLRKVLRKAQRMGLLDDGTILILQGLPQSLDGL